MNISFERYINGKTLLCDLVYQIEKDNYLLSVVDKNTNKIELTKIFYGIEDAIKWVEELQK